MAGRLGVLGSNQSTASQPSGRLGVLKYTPVTQPSTSLQKPADSIVPDSSWAKMKPEAQQRLIDNSKQVAQSKSESEVNPLNIAKAVGTAAIVNPLNFAKDVIVGGVNEGQDLIKQATIGAQNNGLFDNPNVNFTNPELVQSLKDNNYNALKEGKITQQQFNDYNKKLDAKVNSSKESLTKSETEQGIKYDPSLGAMELLDTVANVSGLGEIAKIAFKKTAEVVASKLGRALTKDEVTNLAEKAATTEIKPTATTEVQPVDHATARSKTEEALGTKLTDNQASNLAENAPKIETPQVAKTEPTIQSTKAETYNPEELSKSAKNSFLTAPEEKLAKYDRLQGKSYSISEAKTGLTQTGEDKAGRIVFGKNDAGETIIKDGRHLLEAYRQEGIEIPSRKIAFEDGLTKSDILPNEANKISGNSLRIQQNAVEKKLVDKMGDLPEYKSINMKEQADEAIKLINENKQMAIDIIDGKVNPPGNLKSQSIHQALEEVAMREGDGELLTKLAKSHVNTELSESAQKLRIAAERDPHSPVEQIRQLQETRAKASQSRYKTTVDKELKKASNIVSKVTPKASKETWASFIKNLEC